LCSPCRSINPLNISFSIDLCQIKLRSTYALRELES
ncbi:hypothetical protein T4E_6890, partial [Trichinella pseudospiralis]